MATEKTQEWQDTTNGAAANSEPWGNEVADELQIVLEAEREGFIGTLLEMDKPTATGIIQIHLADVYDLNENFLGERMFINGTRDLVNKLKTVPPKSQIRAEWVSSMNTGQKTPMRVYKVQWR